MMKRWKHFLKLIGLVTLADLDQQWMDSEREKELNESKHQSVVDGLNQTLSVSRRSYNRAMDSNQALRKENVNIVSTVQPMIRDSSTFSHSGDGYNIIVMVDNAHTQSPQLQTSLIYRNETNETNATNETNETNETNAANAANATNATNATNESNDTNANNATNETSANQ